MHKPLSILDSTPDFEFIVMNVKLCLDTYNIVFFLNRLYKHCTFFREIESAFYLQCDVGNVIAFYDTCVTEKHAKSFKLHS